MADYEIAGVELETPLLNAAGSINGGNEEHIIREVAELAATPIGAITVGSATFNPQIGNQGETYAHNPKTGASYNALGLPNIGDKAMVRLIPFILDITRPANKPLIVSVSPSKDNKENGTTLDQTKRLIHDMIQTEADLIEFNTSCPNIVVEGGGRKPILGYDVEMMHKVIDAIRSEAGEKIGRVGLKLPPYILSDEIRALPEIAAYIKTESGIGYIATSNTIPPREGDTNTGLSYEVGEGKMSSAGGKSGPATTGVGRSQLNIWKQQLEGSDIDIVSMLGVTSGAELAKRMELGAAAAGGVTFLWESQNRGITVEKIIIDWADTLTIE